MKEDKLKAIITMAKKGTKFEKRNAITILEGRVPTIPPTFVPYLSAITVIAMTTQEDIKKGMMN